MINSRKEAVPASEEKVAPEPAAETASESAETPVSESAEAPAPESAEVSAPEPAEEPAPEPAKEADSYLSPPEVIQLKPISFGNTDEEVKAKLSKVLSCSNESAAAIMESCAMYGVDFTQMTLCAYQQIPGTIFFYVSTPEHKTVQILINPEVEPYYVGNVRN